MSKRSRWLLALSIFLVSPAVSVPAFAQLQCVPYAREVSGIAIHGDAHTWWQQASGVYQRGSEPSERSVIVFRSSRAMPLGHVAVVSKIIDARHVLLDHANWSRPGMIEHDALAEDVSESGDWSEVRVWYGPSHGLGGRINPAFGFIYNAPAQTTSVPDTQIVSAQPQTGEVVLASLAG